MRGSNPGWLVVGNQKVMPIALITIDPYPLLIKGVPLAILVPPFAPDQRDVFTDASVVGEINAFLCPCFVYIVVSLTTTRNTLPSR